LRFRVVELVVVEEVELLEDEIEEVEVEEGFEDELEELDEEVAAVVEDELELELDDELLTAPPTGKMVKVPLEPINGLPVINTPMLWTPVSGVVDPAS
jgi:hypothetical protein